MSSDSRRVRSRRRRGRAFALSLAVVIVALAVVGLGAAALGTAQGPRVTDVQVDPEAAVTASGSRLIVTTTQALAPVDTAQVTVEPEVAFTVDTSGRTVGVQFARPLDDDTDYTVTIADVRGAGGGQPATLTQTFRTPAAQVHLLQRGDDGDTIFRTDLTGEEALPVFTHAHIEDYRATSSHLVVSVRTDDDRAQLLVMGLDGSDPQQMTLPGDGVVSNLQTADRGDVIGYTFSDASLGADGGRESLLFTASLKSPDADPTAVEVSGADPRVAEWRFVPDTDSILLLSFDGTLLLTGPTGEDATALGSALGIEGIARGSSVAVVDRAEGLVDIDLTDASEHALVEAEGLGPVSQVTPVAGSGTVRTAAILGDSGLPVGTTVALVADDGTTRVLADLDGADAVLQTCTSPSGRYAAVTVAPDAVDNPYDTYLLPMPAAVETRVFDLREGEGADPVVALSGFAVSWCQAPVGS
ncbi:Ig-like domain-containing protein [Microbacterium fluvii]|uniref:Ig-like domain-containing protein n=1 Tax=Microbacterium fluvii TaxID=415215 RepID=A0ABW2HD68_9MICO|nr:Ig-like domain-containing protein [Microbacterium fluvii]MCU4672688.1 Ig-like domain-containing protein [Microbacterium fluvii]